MYTVFKYKFQFSNSNDDNANASKSDEERELRRGCTDGQRAGENVSLQGVVEGRNEYMWGWGGRFGPGSLVVIQRVSSRGHDNEENVRFGWSKIVTDDGGGTNLAVSLSRDSKTVAVALPTKKFVRIYHDWNLKFFLFISPVSQQQ